jgi:hypothetical protein
MGVDVPFAAPLMQARQEETGEWINPFTIATEQQGSVSPFFNHNYVMACAKQYLADTTVDPMWLFNVRNYSMEDAINGCDGVDFIDLMPMSTSGGFYYPGAKRKYFTFCEETNKYVPDPDIVDHVKAMELEYATGNRCYPVFNATLKDEPLKLSKVLSGKTRVFTASDIVFTIIVRMQYLGICKAVMENNFRTECAVGMNHYRDWDTLYRYLTKHGCDRMVAGDYGNYDKSMPPVFILAAFWVLDEWRSFHMPLSPHARAVSRGIATDVAYPLVNVNKELIQFYGGNPSGHPLTSIVNSIANSLFMRFAWLKIGLPLDRFRFSVSLMTYGDDNTFGSSEDEFNHTTVSNVLKAHGVEYTMADKTSASVPFLHIKDIDFLKRGFARVQGRIVAPLALKSVDKSMCLWVAKDTISEEERLAQCYRAARREWALHGEDVFNRNVGIMRDLLALEDFSPISDYLDQVYDRMGFEDFFEYMFEDYDNDDSSVGLSTQAVWDSSDDT